MMHFFRKKKNGDFSDYVKRFIYPDDNFLIFIVKHFLNELLTRYNCTFKDDSAETFLKNFK